MQQGFLAFLCLGRLMKHPQGFTANAAFRFGGQSASKTDELYCDSNSQRAILCAGQACSAPIPPENAD